jgi:translation initiation factor IF-3
MTVDETHTLCYTAWPVRANTAPGEVRAISAGEYRVNERIRAREVRLITDTNENVGVVPLQKALQLAADRELDLVEVAPNANPPVCKIMDFGKFLYERAKKEREARKQQKQIEVKEIRLRPKTDDHHRTFKVRDARRWLEEGMKVKVRIRFRGREITYPEIARDMLVQVADDLKDIAIIEQEPNMEGRTMLMVLAPASEKKK